MLLHPPTFGRDRHVRPPAQGGGVVHPGDGLLRVLQATGRAVERSQPGDRRVDVPGGVGVDADPAVRSERVAHRLAGDKLRGDEPRAHDCGEYDRR